MIKNGLTFYKKEQRTVEVKALSPPPSLKKYGKTEDYYIKLLFTSLEAINIVIILLQNIQIN